MDVNSTLIIHEVLVDDEASLNWAVGVELLLNCVNTWEGPVRARPVSFPSSGPGALGVALSVSSTARGVWVAVVGDDACLLKELPSLGQVAALTAHVSGVAGDELLG